MRLNIGRYRGALRARQAAKSNWSTWRPSPRVRLCRAGDTAAFKQFVLIRKGSQFDLACPQRGAQRTGCKPIESEGEPMKISRQAYADMFGPTVGDKVRLADTELFVEVERTSPSTAKKSNSAAARSSATAWARASCAPPMWSTR